MTYEEFHCPNDLTVRILPGTRQEVQYLYEEIFTNADYEQAGITVKEGDTVIDIGANVGLFSLKLLNTYKQLQLIAIEPVPTIFKVLSYNLNQQLKETQKLLVLNLGIADTEKTSTIFYYPNIPANSTLYPENKYREFQQLDQLISAETVRRYNPKLLPLYYCAYPFIVLLKPFIRNQMLKRLKKVIAEPCELVSVSELIKKHNIKKIDLLKVDAEGSELSILKGIQAEDWEKIQQLAIESSDLMTPNTAKKIENILLEKKYQVTVKGINKKNELALIYATKK